MYKTTVFCNIKKKYKLHGCSVSFKLEVYENLKTMYVVSLPSMSGSACICLFFSRPLAWEQNCGNKREDFPRLLSEKVCGGRWNVK